MGMYILLFLGTTPIGSVVIGRLAESIGVQETVMVMAGICLVGVGAGFAYARRAVPGFGGTSGPAAAAVVAEPSAHGGKE